MTSAWLRQKRGWMARDRRNPPARHPELVEPLGTWLNHFPWDWFTTMTFRYPVGGDAAHRSWSRWVADLEETTGHRTRWARALEYQRRGVIHYHALVWFGGGPQARRLSAMDRWCELGFGFSRIVTYDPQLGAAHYLGKYVAKDGEVDYGGKWWPARPRKEPGP